MSPTSEKVIFKLLDLCLMAFFISKDISYFTLETKGLELLVISIILDTNQPNIFRNKQK